MTWAWFSSHTSSQSQTQQTLRRIQCMPRALPAGGSRRLFRFPRTSTDKLALVLKNTTTNRRHLDNQEMTAALLFYRISLYPSHTLFSPHSRLWWPTLTHLIPCVCVCVFPQPVTSCCLSKGIVPRSNSLTLLPRCHSNTFSSTSVTDIECTIHTHLFFVQIF